MFSTMPLIDTLANLWTFCPAGGAVSIPTSTAASNSAEVKTEKPQASAKAG